MPVPPDAEAAALLADLNEPQRQAVTHRDGPLLVIAGPGSGKTRVITRRAAFLVRTGVPSHNILAITFTNKAADEMKRRIDALGVRRGMWVYTFHALGVRLLREFGELADVQPGFSIYDENDALRAVKDAMEAAQVSGSLISPDTARARISDAKSWLETPAAVADRARWHEEHTLARIYEAYEYILRQRNAVDFDDLLMRVAIVLHDRPDITERLNWRFRYVLIDEYQDTNHAQYLIARYLSQHHGNICATGDPDQSIYAWRGADVRNILEFERDFPNAAVVRLEQNYRSTPQILAAADRLIAHNRRRKPKTLWTQNAAGAPVRAWQFADGLEEADRIANTLRELRIAEGRPWSDFALFYRINAVSRGLEDALRHRGIPYKIARGVEFYNRKEIRDTLAYLRLLVNPADEIALLRIINAPPRGIGRTTIDKLVTHANEAARPLLEVLRAAGRDEIPPLAGTAKRVRPFVELIDGLRQNLRGAPIAEAVNQVLLHSGLEDALRKERESGGEDRLANVQELVTAAIRYEQEYDDASLPDFLHRVSLTSDQDAVDEHAGVVMLMTLHAAKGLEFPVVFLVGLEQGLLPHDRAMQEGGDVEEERRLCFVGLTRARQRLYVTRALERMIRGRPTPRPPSQFVFELADTAPGETGGADAIEFRNFQRGAGAWPQARPDEWSESHRDDQDETYGDSETDEGPDAYGTTEPPSRGAGPIARSGRPVYNPRTGLPDFSAPPRRPRRTPFDDDADAGSASDRGFIPTFDDLPPDEAARYAPPRRHRKLRSRAPDADQLDESPGFEHDEYTHAEHAPAADTPDARHSTEFGTWTAGTLVQHPRFGVGEVLSIRRTGDRTRANIRFAGHGEKTIILEMSPVRRLRPEH
ncbi:MAG: UvrD-helicase domain-containing protein [Planctomycetota bacterium]